MTQNKKKTLLQTKEQQEVGVGEGRAFRFEGCEELSVVLDRGVKDF